MQGIIHSVFLFLHLYFRSCANIENCNATSELRQSLLQLLLVIVRSGGFHLCLDLSDACFDGILFTSAIDNGSVVFVNGHFFSTAEIRQRDIFQFQTGFFRNHLATSQNCDVLQHRFTTITKTWSFYRRHFQGTADFIHHQGGQCLSVQIFGNDQ